MCKKSNISRKTIIVFALILTIILLIFFNVRFRFVKVDGESMYPKLSDGQLVLINKNCKDIDVEDIIVFKTNDGYSIKRVIATKGDIVTLLDNYVYINEVRISPYTYEGITPVTYNLDSDEYFVVGDNYLVSYDSRDYGPIQKSSIIGKVIIEF